MPQERARYSNWVKQQVKLRYPLCRTTADKKALAKELGIIDEDNEGHVSKLYNLASRLGATGHDEAEQDAAAVADTDERLLIRDDFETTKFTREADRYLRSEFGRRPPAWIGVHLHLSETAVTYRARHIGLRKPVKFWNARKVAFWLGMGIEELRALAAEGMDVIPQADRSGHVQLEVVSTASLGRWLHEGENLKKVRGNGADEFFLREILESLEDLISGKAEWELCKFLNHGHVCQNPYTDVSFGLFCTNTDRQKAGADPRCSVRDLAIEDIRPS